MSKISRRKFIGSVVAGVGVTTIGAAGINGFLEGSEMPSGNVFAGFKIDPSVKSPADKVKLGKSGIQISLVGIGTGSGGWGGASQQTRLGQAEFTRLIRSAHDRGITFYDLADQYGSHPYFRKAMSGVARDQYVIQTKTFSRTAEEARRDIERFLVELNTDYIDSLIIHNVTDAEWTARYGGVMEVFDEAKKAGKIRSKGVTCHSFGALQSAEKSDWVEVNQVRWNQRESHMDGDVETVRALFRKMRIKGQGMIGMKVVGQGDLVQGTSALTPEECFRFQLESGVVDAFVVGVQRMSHVDQLIEGTQMALNQVGYRRLNTENSRRI